MSRIITILLALFASQAFSAADKLVITSPHRKSIQDEFIPAFQEHYKKSWGREVQVDWLDQGGTSDDVRFIRSKFAKNPASAGIDIFWGGGGTIYRQMADEGWLQAAPLERSLLVQLPAKAGGVPLRDALGRWYGSAISSFGIFYNIKVMKLDKLPALKTWEDLANPLFFDNISLTDPRRSGTSTTMFNIILQSAGWEEGWRLLTAIGGNTRKFTHSSSDPIKAVVSADAAAAMAIDFYALAKIGDLGRDNLGFVLPEKQTVLDPDPIAMLKGAPNKVAAQRFIAFVLDVDAQRLLVLPKGAPNGPKLSTLGRMSVNVRTYEETRGAFIGDNPFVKENNFFKLDQVKAAKLDNILNDLVGAMLVDTHTELKEAWQALIKSGVPKESLAKLVAMPLTEKEALALADKWQDNVLRNKKINEWTAFAKKKYGK